MEPLVVNLHHGGVDLLRLLPVHPLLLDIVDEGHDVLRLQGAHDFPEESAVSLLALGFNPLVRHVVRELGDGHGGGPHALHPKLFDDRDRKLLELPLVQVLFGAFQDGFEEEERACLFSGQVHKLKQKHYDKSRWAYLPTFW